MHIFRQEIWCIEDGGADSILRMEVLTIRDVFILNFAPVSLSVSPPRTPRVCHAFQQQATDNCRVGQTATQDMSCMQSKVCSTAQELTGSQHSSWNIVHKLSPQPALRKQQVLSSSECFECQCTRAQSSLKGRPMICEFYTNLLYNYVCFFQVINALQKPTPNWMNLWRNVRNFSKLSEMSQKMNDSEMGWYIW